MSAIYFVPEPSNLNLPAAPLYGLFVKNDGRFYYIDPGGTLRQFALVSDATTSGTTFTATGVAGTNTVTGTVSSTVSAGQALWITPANSNTGAATLNLTGSGFGAKSLFARGSACVGGELIAGVPTLVIYDGTVYNILSPVALPGSPIALSSVAGTNTVTASTPVAIGAYVTGLTFWFVPANTNSGATTLNVSSLGAKSVLFNGAACSGGELVVNVPTLVYYDGTQFNIGSSYSPTLPVTDTNALVKGSSDVTKKARLEVDGITTGNTRVITIPDRDVTINDLGGLTNSLGADVALNNGAAYFDGPSVAQGSAGTWFASGTVTITSPGGSSVLAKLHDGTTVFASASHPMLNAAGGSLAIALSGLAPSPAGNLRISVIAGNVGAKIVFNFTGNSKDSTITAIRVG